MGVWFASDVHLDATRPDIGAAFSAFLRERVHGADALFVLGDLFEAWVGDDGNDPCGDAMIEALRALSDAGTECFFMHGNRDFLVGDAFAAQAGLTLLPDEYTQDFYGTKVLLMHGDSLCTDDHDYQQFRAMVRDPQWQRQFLALPLEQRSQMARAARDASQASMAGKPAAIMDVNQQAVEEVMARHDVQTLLHGHTHRPAQHRFERDGQALQRLVLGDWYDQGRVFYWDENGCQAIALPPHSPAAQAGGPL